MIGQNPKLRGGKIDGEDAERAYFLLGQTSRCGCPMMSVGNIGAGDLGEEFYNFRTIL